MPPKGSGGKAKAKPKAAAVADPVPPTAEFSMELRGGETDRSNTEYLLALEDALSVIDGHPVLKDMVAEAPRGISNTATETGFQSVFDQRHYVNAMKSGTYTAGCNLFWVDMRWSATPGVPLRLTAVQQLAKNLFAEPTPYPGALHVAMSPSESPLDHTGAWRCVSPEELHHAMIFAIADAVRTEPTNLELLNGWKRCALSTTITFKNLETAEARMWYALQQRENVSAVHLVVHRSCFQRCHELSRLRSRLMETMSAADVTPQALFNAYNQNLKMTPGAPGTVTLNFVDNASTILNKLIGVPRINAILQEADSLDGLTAGTNNVFDSHSRLQIILNKSGSNVDHRIWLVEGLFYWMKKGYFDKDVSVSDLKGTEKTGNKGLCDVLLFKMALKQQLFQKEMVARTADTSSSPVPFSKWVDQEVAPRMASFMAWLDEDGNNNLVWRTRRSASELRWLQLVEESVFGKTWDSVIKMHVKNGVLPADALNQGTLLEELSNINVQRSLEQAELAGPTEQAQHHEDTDTTANDLTLTTIDSTGAVVKLDINFVDLTDERRETLQAMLVRTRKHIAAHINLIARDTANGVANELARTALGQLRGVVDTTTPTRNKYVAIIYDVKNIGEATHRPNLRTPPQQRDSKHLLGLIEAARARVTTPKLLSGEDAPDGALDVGDIYMVLDGGMFGNESVLMKPFQGKDKSTKRFHLIKDQDSVDARHERVRGIGNIQQTEWLTMVTATPLTLPPKKYTTYNGGTGGNVIGPVVLQSASAQWNSTWSDKKLIYGNDNFIDVGGKLDVDAPEHKRKKQRTDDSLEPVFFHSLPELFWAEMLDAFNIIGVIDLCAGEGTCAMACFRKLIPYCGITFNDQHSARLLAHLEKTILSNMTVTGDSLYDVRFATAVAGDSAAGGGAAGGGAAGGGAAAKPKPRPRPRTGTPNPAPLQPSDPFPDEEHPRNGEARLSGDEQ